MSSSTSQGGRDVQPLLGPDSSKQKCPSCKAEVMTSVKPVTGNLTWILCGSLCIIGCWLGCCLIPFYVNDCLDMEHRCPACDAFIGKYVRVGTSQQPN